MELMNYFFPNEHPEHALWGILIVLYPFMTCSIFGGLFISSLPGLFGQTVTAPLKRIALAISVSFIPFAFLPILLDIGQPFRSFNIMITPRFSSPMAVFGFVFSFVAGVIILQTWLTFRPTLVQLWREKRGIMQVIYAVLSLGMCNDNPESQKIDRKVVKFLQVIGIPAAAILPGYVAFDFSTCPGNPWWNSSLRPVIFLITGIVNGASLTLFFSLYVKPGRIPDGATKTVAKVLIGSLAAVAVLSILEIAVFHYQEGYSAHMVELLLGEGGPLHRTFFIHQLFLGTALPIALLGGALLFRMKGMPLKMVAAAAGALGLVQTFALLWNAVIGGQNVSRSFKGVEFYTPEFLGLKGILASIIILVLPVITFAVISFIIPLVLQEKKDDGKAALHNPKPVPDLEIIRTPGRRAIKVALMDFDGTLSLIRSGWEDVMVPMMVDILSALDTGEPADALEHIVREFVARLTGKQTIYQMIELADQVKQRGGRPLDPLAYKHRYLDLLWEKIKGRVDDVEKGRAAPEGFHVPGTLALLEGLKARNVRIFVASGTDEKYAAREAELLGITPFIEEKVYGAQDDYKQFSKHRVIQRILADHKLKPGELAGFGDGFVEIEDVKAAGGIAVGVATDEPACLTVDAWKRERLIKAGADVIIPNYLGQEELFKFLFPE